MLELALVSFDIACHRDVALIISYAILIIQPPYRHVDHGRQYEEGIY